MSAAADLASGKGHKDENFPVASWLVRPEARGPIMAYYRFARAADDIADNAAAGAEAKLAGLEAMRASLAGESDVEPTAVALRAVCAERRIDIVHGLDLLEAFRRDVTKLRYADWDALIDYCRVSAMPVGRYVLDVHGEDRALWPANDALCAALQIVNHLQDVGKDHRDLDRVYLPQDMLARAGASVADLAADRATPGLRAVIAQAAQRCLDLLRESARFSSGIRDRRLGMEVAVIQRLAVDLATRLKHRDPLAERIVHSKGQALRLAVPAALGRLAGR